MEVKGPIDWHSRCTRPMKGTGWCPETRSKPTGLTATTIGMIDRQRTQGGHAVANQDKRHAPRWRQKVGILIGVTVSIIVVVISVYADRFQALGPMDPGHEKLKCTDCHRAAPGTARQQLQAWSRYMLGVRTSRVDVGHRPVVNDVCLDCHRRKKDKHPVYRFFEPRFEKARQEISPHVCVTCHREHRGKRVSIERTFCQTCHDKLTLKKDPLDVPHSELVKQERWTTCLNCHDFHGNHRRKTPDKLAAGLSNPSVEAYFDKGRSPYADTKIYAAKKEIQHE